MKEHLVFKQEKNIKVKILAVLILMFSVYALFNELVPIYKRGILFCIGILLVGYSVSYRISRDFKNQKLFSVFGLTLFKTKLNIDYPDYISIFSASFSLDNEWGAVSAMGTKERHQKIVVRVFTQNKNFTLFKTKDYQKALEKANELSKLLDVEIHNTIEE